VAVITLPPDFIEQTRLIFGDTLWADFLQAMEEESPVSIRLNPLKAKDWTVIEGEEVPWCRGGYYLKERPAFTFDPLLHAGAYYVQEASSMFLDEVLKQHSSLITHHSSLPKVLDLCAAPGGKSTLLRAAIPVDSWLVSNEPNPKRAQILSENMQKWGSPHTIVTNNYPRDFKKLKVKFDLILVDAPCSGEGMFRKDEVAIHEWSLQNVAHCSRLQREIVCDAWECLQPGGLFIYSTCTFNTHENEENVRWMMEELGAEILPVETKPEWKITGSLLKGFHEPVYRFIPKRTKGEGLFMAVFRKPSSKDYPAGKELKLSDLKALKILPPQREGLGEGAHVELSYSQALQYLRREALTLPSEVPTGMVTMTYQGMPLGTAKNLGTRANNLYPKEWRIKSTYIPGQVSVIKQKS
jgi:16S rRNA C967 or C1407 C5-methylase (RsmB/RsmF family)